MYHLRLLSIGKSKEHWLEEGMAEFIKRMQPIARFECVWAKNEEQLLALALKSTSLICLDAVGKVMDSEEFSSYLMNRLEECGSHVTFVIGGAEGLPLELKKSAPLISLSRLTFTHQLARLILIEQIYRAFEIAKGSQYHK